MLINLTEDQWNFVDELLRADQTLIAIRFIKESTACRLNDAIEAVDSRKQEIGVSFSGNTLARVKAFDTLDKVPQAIRVIEGSWDGDSLGWFIRLTAIVEEPSQYHFKYTQYGLCLIRGIDAQVERAITLGEELAQAAGTTFYLTSVEVDDEKPVVGYATRYHVLKDTAKALLGYWARTPGTHRFAGLRVRYKNRQSECAEGVVYGVFAQYPNKALAVSFRTWFCNAHA